MADEEDKDDKTEEPTAKRLQDARDKGDVIYSAEAGTWLVLAVGALTVTMNAAPASRSIGRAILQFIAAPHTFAMDGPALIAVFSSLLLKVAAAVGLAFAALLAAGIGARMLQDRLVFSGEKLKPSFDKVNPVKGFGRVFGAQAWGNFAKGLAKFVIVGAAGAWALWPTDSSFESAALLDLAVFWPLVQEKSVALIGACLAAFGAIAIADYAFTRQAYMKKLRMSRHDLKEEFRQSEGDPQVRAKLKQVRAERARTRMLAAVPEATLVVTNPTHYAVALKYEAGKTAAPVCVAKGVDEIALRIRAVAEEASVPIIEDPPLARALYASSELDQAIPREHYEAVAKVIGYVLRLAQRRKGASARPPNRPL